MVKTRINLGMFFLCIFLSISCFCQKKIKDKELGKVSKLFQTSTILPVHLSYSNKSLKKLTNDSTHISISLDYLENADSLRMVPIKIRARGNFRRQNCYFSPLKIRIKKENSKGTLFTGNKKLKMVLPCLRVQGANDNIVQELLAYKLYEVVSPYHFKTKLLDLTLDEQKGKKIDEHKLKAFFIEDINEIEDRFGGNELKRNVHALQQDTINSIRNAMFQYMIGNTDFSTVHRHNQKILFLNGSLIPIPYDFDNSGLCNASYSVVSQIGEEKLPIEKVTQRLYRGFKRSDANMEAVRGEFLENQSKMIAVLENHKEYFESPQEYERSKKYILGFFRIIQKPSLFKSKIVDMGRVR